MNREILLTILIAFITLNINAQYTEEFYFTIDSEHMEEERNIWVSLPKYYNQNKYDCHTLYVLDGDSYRSGETFRAIRNELFESGGYIEPLIIVGIEQKRRSYELSPYGKTGAKFSAFLSNEVIPLIDSKFQTNGNRIIAGHSLGGYYALHIWMTNKDINSCLAFSPAIFNKEGKIIDDINEYLTTNQPSGTIYINNGTDSHVEKRIKKYIPELLKVFETKLDNSEMLQYKEYLGHGHNFTPIVGLTDGLLHHFSFYQFDDETITKLWAKELDPIPTYQKRYGEIDKWAGRTVERDNDLFNNLASHYLNTQDTLKALKLIDYAIELDSTDAFSYMTKGEILMDLDKKQARESLIRSLILLKPENVFESTKNFREYEFWKGNIEELLRKIDE